MFETIDAEPLSTASLAQVHRATLVGGRQVVVKAQHRGVASLMKQDMANHRSNPNPNPDPNPNPNPQAHARKATVQRRIVIN